MNMSNPFPVDDDLPMAEPVGVAQRPGVALVRSAAPTFGTYLSIVRERKWLVLGTAAVVTVLATVAVNLMTPIYQASATILIENNKRSVVPLEEIYGVPAGSREFFQTQAEFMRSREVGIRVIKALGLENNPYFNPELTPEGKEQAAEGNVKELSQEALEEQVLMRYKAGLDISPIKNSQLVEIRFESPDPVLAAKIANQTAESYITADLDARFDMQQTASRWLNDRLNQLRTDLENAEANLQAYREEIGLVATPTSALGGNERQLDNSSDRLIAARVERQRLEQVYHQVQRGSRNRYEVPEVFNNPAVVAARAAEANAEKRMAEVAGSMGASHPAYKQAQSELELARSSLRKQSEAVISSISKAYEVARETERALEQEVASSKGNIQEINRKEGKLNVLQREVATNQQIYQTFLAKVKETDATADFQNPIARVVDPAVPPLLAAKPPKPQLPMLQHQQPQSLFSESVRSALTGVRLSLMNVERPVVAFTSTLPGEGKSTMAASFAIEQGRTKRTLLIDCDMRKPAVRRMLNIPENTKGLSDLFHGEPIENCVLPLNDLDISVLVAGTRARNAHDLVMSPRFTDVLEQLKEHFELIVIDTPPLELVSDALPIGANATGLIYVVKANSTLIPMARRGLERIAAANVRILGVILNNHDFEKAGRYYGEYNTYGETYGQGFYGEGHQG